MPFSEGPLVSGGVLLSLAEGRDVQAWPPPVLFSLRPVTGSDREGEPSIRTRFPCFREGTFAPLPPDR
jgi:hypothetical protein